MIAFDIDGVLANTQAIFCKALGLSLQQITKYNIRIPGMIAKEIEGLLNKAILHSWQQIIPHEYAAETVEFVYSRTRKPVLLVTSRMPSILESVTYQWLKLHFHVPLRVKFAKDKLPVLLNSRNQIFVEDRLQTANLLADAGITCFLISRPWNAGRAVHTNVIRMENLKEVTDYIKQRGIL